MLGIIFATLTKISSGNSLIKSDIKKNINLIKRIGLSATPNRKYDMVGNLAIKVYMTLQMLTWPPKAVF